MSDSHPEKIVVVGAGQMGTGIAHAFATNGFTTVMVDTSADALTRAREAIDAIILGGVARNKISAEAGAQARSQLTVTVDLAHAAQGAALMVETVSENLEIKRSVLSTAEAMLAEGAIIATNTSALSITQLATFAARPDRVIGMHFFNPVHKMKLVEIVLGLATGADVVARAQRYAKQIGKTAIVVNESPGLTTSRMSALLGNEAMYMLQEGTASADDIDTALRLGFNHPMGPLELGDLTGWDTRLAVLQYLHRTLGEKFRPCPLIIKMVAAGRTGRKAGHGVYKYLNGTKVAGSGLRSSSLT
jgi:3-hydroxybutyryl-CoA dehydrogenase